MHNKDVGSYYETLAKNFLKQQCLTIIDHNVNYHDSEIDLIAIQHNVLVFIEVRYRKNTYFGSALESITSRKIAKIKKGAQHFLQKNPYYQRYYCRFDVIVFEGNSVPLWTQNAF